MRQNTSLSILASAKAEVYGGSQRLKRGEDDEGRDVKAPEPDQVQVPEMNDEDNVSEHVQVT